MTRAPLQAAWRALDAPREPTFPRGRRFAAFWLALLGLPALTALLTAVHGLSLEGDVMPLLLLVTVIAVVGGAVVACFSAVAAALLIDWFFVAPLHTLRVAQADQALSLVVFVVVAGVTGGCVELAARRRQRIAELERRVAELESCKVACN